MELDKAIINYSNMKVAMSQNEAMINWTKSPVLVKLIFTVQLKFYPL